MKKLVLAMACVLSLALLASCKQDAASSISVSNQEFQEGSIYYGDFSFTAAPKEAGTPVNGVTPFVAATGAAKDVSLAYSSKKKFGSISWGETADKVNTNYTTYSLTIPYAYCDDTTADPKVYAYSSVTLQIYEIGGEYFYDNYIADATNGANKTKLDVEGSLDGEFKIASIGVVNVGTSFFEIKDLSFEAK